jgi:hypothetical protein
MVVVAKMRASVEVVVTEMRASVEVVVTEVVLDRTTHNYSD